MARDKQAGGEVNISNEAVEAAAKALWEPNERDDEWVGEFDSYKDYLREYATKALEAAAPHMLAAVWEEAYGLGYADHNVGAAPTRANPHKTATPTPVAPTVHAEHGLARMQVTSPVCVWCKCGAEFDAYGDRGAINKLNDHISYYQTARTP